MFDIPDGELKDTEDMRLRVCDEIRRVKPNIIITHWKNSMHKDHATTHNIVNDARFLPAWRPLSGNCPRFSLPSSTMRKTGRMQWITSRTCTWTFHRRLLTCG